MRRRAHPPAAKAEADGIKDCCVTCDAPACSAHRHFVVHRSERADVLALLQRWGWALGTLNDGPGLRGYAYCPMHRGDAPS